MEGLRRGRTLHQLAVDAVPQAGTLLQRLKMNIRGLRLEGLDHDGIHHADDRSILLRGERSVNCAIVLPVGHELHLGGVHLHHGFHRQRRIVRVLLRLQPLEDVQNLLLGGHAGPDASSSRARDLFVRRKIERIRKCHRHSSRQLCERQGLGLRPELQGLSAQQIRIDEEVVRQRNRRHVEIGRRRQRERRRIDQVLPKEKTLQRQLRLRRLLHDRFQLLRIQHLALKECFREAAEMGPLCFVDSR